MADRLALIPATAKRAEGVNFEVGVRYPASLHAFAVGVTLRRVGS